MSMRDRFYALAGRALEDDERVAVVSAEIGVDQLPAHPRHFNVGIREQLMIAVAAGLALEGMRAIAHSYTPFLVERPYEQVKLDLGHQDLGAILVSTGASYDAARAGRTHQAPEDVSIVAALPGWTIHAPGHPDELERVFTRALGNDDRVYIRMSEEQNAARVDGDGIVVLRRGEKAAPLVLAVGPTLTETLAATADLDVTVAYTATPRPFDREGLRSAFGHTRDVVLVEPYLAGTSTAEVAAALVDHPTRILSIGVPLGEFRHYGTPAEHRAAHGLDARGIRASIDRFLALNAG